MQQTTEKYRGYTIAVTPLKDHDDLWDFEYQLTPAAAAPLPKRANTPGGHIGSDAAVAAGFELARIEVDNLLALQPSAG